MNCLSLATKRPAKGKINRADITITIWTNEWNKKGQLTSMEESRSGLLDTQYDEHNVMTGMPDTRTPMIINGIRFFLEIFSIEHHSMYGHESGQRVEIDLFNMGECCGFLYWGTYHALQLYTSGGSHPWEPDKNICHGICPDLYNQVRYLLIREER